MVRRGAALPILSIVWLLGGCPEPDLGYSPFLCNPGQPRCPDGYSCVKRAIGEVCVKDGAPPPADQGVDAPSPVDAAVADWPQLPDRPRPAPDRPPVRWDGQPRPPDLPQKTEAPTHLGCQNNTECQQQDPSSPCCCPFVLNVWTCLPLCFNPLCL